MSEQIVVMIGGIGPESTIEYYRAFIAAGHRAIVLNSVELPRLLAWMNAGQFEETADYLAAEVGRLAAAGATVGLIAANSPHVVFDEVQARSPIPLVSIVEATRAHVQSLGLTRAALFGTRFTMQGGFFPRVFERHGLTVVMPTESEQAYIHDKYINELLKNVFAPATERGLFAIADSIIERDRVEALILGGTELPLLLKDSTYRGIPLLDTTKIHVGAVLAQL